MRKILCSWLLYLFASAANAQIIFDAYSLSTASADLISSKGIFLTKNPAGVVNIEGFTVEFSQIIPYSIPNLSTNAISVKGKWKENRFALEYAQTGIRQFKAHYWGLSTGLKISKNTDLGIKILTRTQPIINEQTSFTFLLEGGIIQQPFSRLKTALLLKYRMNEDISEYTKSSISIGVEYVIDPTFINYLSIEMNELGELYFRAAIDYTIKKNISIRIGWNSNENSICGGFSYGLKNMKIEMSTSYHNNLGMSYGAALCYRIIAL